MTPARDRHSRRRRAGAHGDRVVGALHGLAAGHPAEARDVAGQVFLARAHVDQVDRLVGGARHQLLQLLHRQHPHAVLGHQPRGVGFGRRRGPGPTARGKSTRSPPRSSSRPASSQPEVPLRRLTTFGSFIRWSTRAPMMLRVRPAQLITTVALGRALTRSWMRSASSPPGALRPPGMQKRRYSSGVRVSRMISSSPRRWRSASSSALDGRDVVLRPPPSRRSPCSGRSCPTRWAGPRWPSD